MAFAILGEAFLLLAFAMLAAGEPHGSLRIPDVVAALPGLALARRRARAAHRRLRRQDGPRSAERLDAARLRRDADPGRGGAQRRGRKGGRDRPHPLPAARRRAARAGARRSLSSASSTAFYGVAIGVTQQNPKAVLAYSSVSQMGVIAAALGMALAAGDAERVRLVAFYAANHVLVKGALFLAVGAFAARGVRPGVWSLLARRARAEPRGPAVHRRGARQGGGEAAVRLRRRGGLAAASSAGSALLMLHFVSRLPAVVAVRRDREPRARSSASGRRRRSARSSCPSCSSRSSATFGDALSLAKLWDGLWPILVGGAPRALARARRRPPAAHSDRRHDRRRRSGVRPRRSALGALFDRIDAAFRRWPAAGLALLAIVLALVYATAGAG